MMVDKDQDLGLSLSLGGGGGGDYPSNIHNTPLQLNLIPSLMVPSSVPSPNPSTGFNTINKIPHKPIWTSDIFPSSDPNRGSTREFLGGIDVNRAPSSEEEPGVSSPNSTVSSVSGKRSERELGNGLEEQDMDRACYRGTSDEEDGDNSRKKLRLTKDQSAVLEESFKEHNTLNPKQKMALAKQLGLRPRQVEVWFQNRRARTKLKQTEVDCEFLKKCCENLTEENRRLQKEVQELRALKLSPHFYMQMTPPTTLTMCPACERVGVPPQPGPPPPDPRPHMGPLHHHRRAPINPWAPAVPFDTLRPSL